MSEQHQEDHILGGMGGIQMMGIVNALKTGDPSVDMFIAMCIPVVLRLLFSFAERWRELVDVKGWLSKWRSRRNQHERFIVHKRTKNSYYGTVTMDDDTQNPVLLKAIMLYIHHKCNLHLERANLDLTSIGNTATGNPYTRYNTEYYSDDESHNSAKTFVGMLSKYEVVKKPPENEWHNLGMFGTPSPAAVELLISEEEQDEGDGDNKSRHVQTMYHFVSSGATAIDDFIAAAYTWYLDELRKQEDNARHFYELKTLDHATTDDGGDNYDGFQYTRYRLSDEKTFESLFFRQKESLLKLIDHFQKKTGKYCIKGYPHKLGLLLHGPPGTGKTSLIKALAEYTGRSIVNVPLSRISTNSELMSVFFDRKFYIQGEYVPIQLGFKDVIFVIEDIDAASKIVKRRDGQRVHEATTPDRMNLPSSSKSMWTILLGSNDSDCQELVKLLMDKSDRLNDAATSPEVLLSIAKRMVSVPGLGLIGEGKNDASENRICEDAVQTAESLMNEYSVVDRFINVHAKCIIARIEAGSEVDDALVDELLGSPSAISSRNSWVETRCMSSDDENTNDSNDSDKLVATVAKMLKSGVMSNGKQVDKVETPKKTFEGFGPSLWGKADKDELNLAGLLNVLDGVVDTPGRIVIMTSNHPEMLDEALIRAGRIDKKLMLGFMETADVIDMLKHYFREDLTDDHQRRVEKAVNGRESRPKLNLTPALVEQFCAEHDEIEAMIQRLEEHR